MEFGTLKRHGRIGLVSKNVGVFLAFFSLILTLQLPTLAVENSVPNGAKRLSSVSTQRLQSVLRQLNVSLANHAQAEQLRRDLRLNILESQSARGEQADVLLLSDIHGRFVEVSRKYDQAIFAQVAQAIQQQIDLLQAAQSIDVAQALQNAGERYRPITVELMVQQRDMARRELQLLKRFYRATLPSRERADLFYDLQLNDAIEYLGEIEFALAPEVSVGKMTSQIRAVEKQREDVELKIDAIPRPADPPTEEDKKNQAKLEVWNKQKSDLDAEIQKLSDERAKIRTADAARRTQRGTTFNTLRRFEQKFNDVSQERGDPYFVSARRTLSQFSRTYFYGTSDNLEEGFRNRLNTLSADLATMGGDDPRSAAAKVGSSLRWLEDTNQVPEIVAAIRAQHSMPNAYVSISSNLLNRVGSRPVLERQVVRENVGGRLIRGNARTDGFVTIQLYDDPDQIHANINLSGSVGSGTYAQQGKTQVFANTYGQVAASRNIFANVGGLFADEASVAATFCSTFAGTNSGLKLVNKIARKKFDEAKAQGVRFTTKQAKEQLKESFTKQTDDALVQGRGQMAKLKERMVAESQYIPEIYARTFSSEIMVVAKKSTNAALAAPGLPAPSKVPSDVSVRLHDSTLSIYLDDTFSGKTFTDQELAEEIGRITGDEPVALTPGDGGENESFSITFAQVRPVQFEFDDNRFSVIVSGRRFAQGDKKINEGLKIILRFKIKKVDGQLMFARDGQAEVEYLEPDKRRPVTIAFRTFLLGRLNPEDGGQPMETVLPDNLIPIDDVEMLQDSEIARQMELVQFRAEDGWLHIGWNHRLPNSNPNWVVDLPAIWAESNADAGSSEDEEPSETDVELAAPEKPDAN